MLAGMIGFGAHIVEEEEEKIFARRRLRIITKTMRDFSNPFLIEEERFCKYYRLTQYTATILINSLEDKIKTQRCTAIPPYLQILSVLRFFSEGPFQKGVSSDFHHPMSQAAMSRCIDNVVNALLTLEDELIFLPSTKEARQEISNSFLQFMRVPGILGLIDCFLVSIIRPKKNDEAAFYNYKVGPALNVQVVADCNYIIRNVNICPGSNNDRFIYKHSFLKNYLEFLRNDRNILTEEGPYYVLGDSGYTPSKLLLTPIEQAAAFSPEKFYSDEHRKTRSFVERTFGILSNTFMAVNRARKLYYTPEKASNIVKACIIVHNFRRINGCVDEQNYRDELLHNDADEYLENDDHDYTAGLVERENLINTFYH